MSLTLTQVNSIMSPVSTCSGLATSISGNIQYVSYLNDITHGVSISRDGGFTWNDIGGTGYPGFNQHYTGIACNGDGSVLYVCIPGTGVYTYTSNAWTLVFAPGAGNSIIIPNGPSGGQLDDVSNSCYIAYNSNSNIIVISTAMHIYLCPSSSSFNDTSTWLQFTGFDALANPTSIDLSTAISSIAINSSTTFVVFNNTIYKLSGIDSSSTAMINTSSLSLTIHSISLSPSYIYIMSTSGSLYYCSITDTNFTFVQLTLPGTGIGSVIATYSNDFGLLVGPGPLIGGMNSYISNYVIMAGSPLILVYTLASLQFILPISGGTITTINWGDGTQDTNTTHDYTSIGTYIISILGSGITNFPNLGSGIIRCISFGEIGLTNLTSAFSGCSNLITVPNSLPSTSSITLMDNMFQNATVFNQPIGTWNVSTVISMSYMFHNAVAFNQPIGVWNVSNVSNMDNMFAGATAFNQDISRWNFSQVYAIKNIFTGTSFSQINYDKLLNYWASHPSSRPTIAPGYHMDALGLVYTSVAAHNQLIQSLHIYGDLLVPSYIQSNIPFTAQLFFTLTDVLAGIVPFNTNPTTQYQFVQFTPPHVYTPISNTASAQAFQLTAPNDTYAITIPVSYIHLTLPTIYPV